MCLNIYNVKTYNSAARPGAKCAMLPQDGLAYFRSTLINILTKLGLNLYRPGYFSRYVYEYFTTRDFIITKTFTTHSWREKSQFT